MADPATQFNRPGLSYTGYTPVKTELNPPIQLPGTGELWAQAGKNAMIGAQQVFDTLLKSPLNPLVKKQMELGIKTAQQGMDTIDWANKQGAGNWITGIDANGKAYMIPVAQGGVNVQALVGQEEIGKKKGGGGGRVNDPTESTTNKPAIIGQRVATPGTPPGAPPPGTFFNPATGSYEPLQQPGVTSSTATKPTTATQPDSNAPPTDPADLNRQPKTSQITAPATTNMFAAANGAQAPSPTDFQGPTQAQTDAAVRESLSRNQFVSSEQGLPAGYQPPSQQPQDQDQTPLGKQLMSQWQNQNAHPVAPAGEAKKWAQNNFDTRVVDATYMPHGGPLNQPAYAFHMKGGGTNMVPLSQMVQNGFAPNVAGNQTSMTLSAADQVRQQGQMQPTGAVGGQAPALQQGQGTQPAAQMQPTGNVGQPQQPPAAPAAPEMRDIYGNPISAYTSIPSKGGPSATQLTAGTTSVGTPATALPVSQEEQDKITAELNNRPQSEKDKLPEDAVTGDPEVGRWGGRTYYEDKSGNAPGRYYTTLPGQTSTWTQQRFYFGTDGYHEYPLKDSVIRKNMENEFSGAGGIPGKVFTREEIAKMPIDVVKDWLMQAKWYHNTGGDPTGPTQQRLDAQAETSKSLQRLIDMVQAAKEAKIDPTEYSTQAEAWSQEAAKREAIKKNINMVDSPWWNLGPIVNPDPRTWFSSGKKPASVGDAWAGLQAWWHDEMSAHHPVNRLADAMTSEVKHLTETMSQTPGLKYTTEEAPGKKGVSVYGVTIPLSGEQSSLKEVNRIFENRSQDEVLDGLKQLQSRVNHDYHSTSETAILDGFRIPRNHLNNQTALANKNPLPDPDNKFRDADGNLVNPYGPPKPISEKRATPPPESNVSTARPSPTPMMVIRNDAEMEAFKKNHPGEHFKVPDGRGGYIEYH